PFALATNWADKNDFSGRFLSLRAELVTIDLTPSLGWQVSENFSVGASLVVRLSQVELLRRAPTVNPFTNGVQDVASVFLESDLDTGVGAAFGLLHKVNDRFSWGLSYRSRIEVDYEGDGRLTQISTGNAQLDAIVAGSLPFDTDLPLETSIEFPDMASLGFAFQVTDRTLVEIDVNWTGWSSFDRVDLEFATAPDLTTELIQDYDDVYNYRIGVAIDTDRGTQWRFGALYDETPQPEETTGPLLPDADRIGGTIGWGNERLDLALMYLDFDERTTTTNRENFFGTYKTEVWLFGATLKF
ncbi:MAG: outer membrane protein transport protein, partial [Acidobacteriota bacterium]